MLRGPPQPDIVSWNGLLGAYALAGQIDNAYYAWERMKKLGVVPTRYTSSRKEHDKQVLGIWDN